MYRRTDDLRITQTRPLLPPAILIEELPATEHANNVVANSRQAIADVVMNRDSRFVVIVGPCSIHDTRAAVEYAERAKACLSIFPPSRERDALIALPDYVLARDR